MMPQPWERQKGETYKAFEAWSLYVDLGPNRSYRLVAETLSKSETLIHRWAHRFTWQDRLGARDSYLASRKMEDEVREGLENRREMADRHARVASLVMTKVIQRLVGDEAAGIRAIDPNSLSPSELKAWMDVAVRVERLSRGDDPSRPTPAAALLPPETPAQFGEEFRPDERWMRDYARVLKEAGLLDDDDPIGAG